MKLSATAKILIALVIFITAGVLHIAFNVTGILGRGGELRWNNTRRGVVYTMDAGAVFHGHNSPFFYIATRTGVRYISSVTGESRLHYALNLRRPILSGRGEWAAVSEGERGRVIYVFDSNSRAFTETFNHPIHSFSINRTGFLSVILQLDEGYVLHIFNRMSSGDPIKSRFIHPNTHPGIIPITSEVSDDGLYIAVGLLDVNNRLISKVQLGYTTQNAAWGTDGIFFEQSFPDEMLLALRKTANNRLVVVTDVQIVIYTRDANDLVTETAAIPLHNRLEKLAFDEDGRFAIAFGSPLLNAAVAEPEGTVHIFDANGTRTGSYHTGQRVTHLTMGHNTVIVGLNRNFYALNLQGTQVWEFIALQYTQDIVFLENSDTVLIAGANRADVWRRQRSRDGDDGDFFGIQGQ
jgi:hypothetical protein